MTRYRWRTREDGVIMIYESPDSQERAIVLAPALVEGTDKVPGFLRVVERWEALAERVSTHFGIPPGWILAMIWRESGGNPRAFRREPNGWTGVGLMQITAPALKGGLSDEALFDPETNILHGAKYVAYLLERDQRQGHDRDFVRIAASFNHGSVGVTDANPWGMISTGSHISTEVSALNYYLLRGEKLAAEKAAAVQFSTAELLGPDFGRLDFSGDDERTPVDLGDGRDRKV